MYKTTNNATNATASVGASSRPFPRIENQLALTPAQMASAPMPPFQNTLIQAPAQDEVPAQVALNDAVITLNNLMGTYPCLQSALTEVKEACTKAHARLDSYDQTFHGTIESTRRVQGRIVDQGRMIQELREQLHISQRNFDNLHNELQQTDAVLEQTERENIALRQSYRLGDLRIRRQELELEEADETIMFLDGRIERYEYAFERLERHIDDRDAAIAQRDAGLQDQDQLIETLDADARETLEEVAAKDSTIREQRDIINRLQAAQRRSEEEEQTTHRAKCSSILQ
jgi:chromosome segregation ATPase